MPLLSNYSKHLLMFSQICVSIVISGKNMEIIFQTFIKQHRWEKQSEAADSSFFKSHSTKGHFCNCQLFAVLSLVLSELELNLSWENPAQFHKSL